MRFSVGEKWSFLSEKNEIFREKCWSREVWLLRTISFYVQCGRCIYALSAYGALAVLLFSAVTIVSELHFLIERYIAHIYRWIFVGFGNFRHCTAAGDRIHVSVSHTRFFPFRRTIQLWCRWKRTAAAGKRQKTTNFNRSLQGPQTECRVLYIASGRNHTSTGVRSWLHVTYHRLYRLVSKKRTDFNFIAHNHTLNASRFSK